MPNVFTAMIPDAVYRSIMDIPFSELFEKGYEVALLDFDNTLGPDRAFEPNDYSRKAVRMIQETGFKCCLVSNAKTERSKKIAEMLDIPCVTCANKPHPEGVIRALKLMGISSDKAIMVGDQVFTDVMAGKLADVHSIMVEKYQPNEIWYVKIKRPFERFVRLVAHF